MGIIISIFNFPKIYNQIIDFHKSIDGNWFTYLSILYKSYVKPRNSKARFDLHDADTDGNPYAIGFLPHKEEWIYECPQKNKAENLLIYGTNSWGQYLLIEIDWKPQNNRRIEAKVKLIFKDENGLVYELNENDLLTIQPKEHLKQYKIAGLTVQVLCPYRKLRIRVRGYLRRKDTNELVFANFRLFWSSLSNVFDFQNDFSHQYLAQELSASGVSTLRAEDRHEQWGQMIGLISINNEKNRQLFLWGNKAKHYWNSDSIDGKVTRIYGFSPKSFAFHVGAVRYTDQYRLRYGYTSLGNGSLYPMSSISSTFNELESIGYSSTKFKIEIKEQNREFDIEIQESTEEYDNWMVCDMKLNGHQSKCLVIRHNLSKNIVIPSVDDLPDIDIANHTVLPITHLNAQSIGLSGGKGASLATLSQLAANSELEFVVPNGLIVTTNAYNSLIDGSDILQDQIERLEKLVWSEQRDGMRKCCEETAEKFSQQTLPPNLSEEIKSNLLSIFGENFETIRFAIRSSALSEDSDEMSSAGQMTTILGVKGMQEIRDAVMKCWSSQFTLVAVEYKRGYGQEINSPMAVVIQEMVDCDSAGVIFTCDPITGDERSLWITANHGIGESVVSAMAEPDSIKLRVNIEANSLLSRRTIGDIESIEIGSKLKSIVLNESQSGTTEVNNENNSECCLSENQCRSLGEVSLEVHRFYGNPRDIEWGIRDNTIYLLQSRPITNLDNWTDWEAMHDMDSGQQSESEYFSRANLGEVFPGASSHMCLSWLVNLWNANGFRNWRKMFKLSKKEFSPYYNRGGGTVSNVYFFMLKTGTFPFTGDTKSTLSQSIQIGLFGHEFNDPEYEDLIKDSNEKAPKKSISLFTKIWLTLGSIKYFLTPGITLREAKRNFKNFNLFDGRNVFTAKDVFEVILDTYHLVEPVSSAHGKVTFCSMIYNVALLNLLKKKDSNNDNDSYADFAQLVSSASQVVSAQVPNLLREIANSIENRQKFREMSDERALKYLLNSETEATVKFKRFLVEYGHRGYKEFDPMSRQWADNPITVIKSLKTMINGDQRLSQTKREKSIDEIISSLKTPLSRSKKFLLKYLIIPWCQSGVSLREEGKHLLIRTYHQYRRAFWRLAKLMVLEGRLPEPELLFHMTLPEVQTLLNERDPTIIGRARLRCKLHPIKEKFKFPETSIGPNIKPRNEMTENMNVLSNGGMARIKGTPVSAGIIKGRCCVALTLEEAQNIRSGDILITYSTDICWSPYFPMLSGLATEIGGLISHGAVIAREYGLPCLVGVEGAHRLFKTGDIVVINTEFGEIYRLQ